MKRYAELGLSTEDLTRMMINHLADELELARPEQGSSMVRVPARADFADELETFLRGVFLDAASIDAATDAEFRTSAAALQKLVLDAVVYGKLLGDGDCLVAPFGNAIKDMILNRINWEDVLYNVALILFDAEPADPDAPSSEDLGIEPGQN